MGTEDGGRRRRRRPGPAVGTTGARFARPDAGSDPPPPAGRHAAPAPREETGPDGLPPGVTPADLASDDETVGRTGARFNSRARRWRRDRTQSDDTAPTGEIETPGATTDDAVPSGASPPDGAPASDGTPPQDGAPPPDWAPPSPRAPAESAVAPASPGHPAVGLGGGVRPYVRTGGRTRARIELALETLVSRPGTPAAPSAPDTEHRAIEAICSEPRSVAEVAALLRVPLGVARVLIADMADGGLLVVHPTAGLFGTDGPDLSVVERVLTGLRRL